MTAALSLADQGFRVALVEKTGALGGQVRNVHTILEGNDTAPFIADLLDRTQSHKNITEYLNSEVTKVGGHIGKFVVTVAGRGNGNGPGDSTTTDISCGAIIAATGQSGNSCRVPTWKCPQTIALTTSPVAASYPGAIPT